jgi:hypothetical protein
MICKVALDLLKRTSEGRLNALEEEEEAFGAGKLAPLLLSMKLLANG